MAITNNLSHPCPIETKKVAVVTGANRGIGLAVVEGLATDFDGDVYLTARSQEKGEKVMSAVITRPSQHNMCMILHHYVYLPEMA